MIVVGTRHFTRDLSTGEWVGGDGQTGLLHEVFAARGTLSGSCAGGDALTNPGADTGIQTDGVRAITPYGTGGGMRVAGAGQLWFGAYRADTFDFSFSCHYDSQDRGFIQAGGPVCGGADPINPGCDVVVSSDGVDAAYWTRADSIFHVTQGTRHWGLVTSGAVAWQPDEYHANLAEHWEATTTPDCRAIVTP